MRILIRSSAARCFAVLDPGQRAANVGGRGIRRVVRTIALDVLETNPQILDRLARQLPLGRGDHPHWSGPTRARYLQQTELRGSAVPGPGHSTAGSLRVLVECQLVTLPRRGLLASLRRRMRGRLDSVCLLVGGDDRMAVRA